MTATHSHERPRLNAHRMRERSRARLRRPSTRSLGWLARRACFAARCRLTDRDAHRPIAAGAIMRTLGPWLPEHRIGRANLAAAFPEKSPAEIETSCAACGTISAASRAEFAHLDRLQDLRPDAAGRRTSTRRRRPASASIELRDDGKPALIFAAHLANWELPALVAAALRARHARALPPPQHRRRRRRGASRSAPAAWAR